LIKYNEESLKGEELENSTITKDFIKGNKKITGYQTQYESSIGFSIPKVENTW